MVAASTARRGDLRVTFGFNKPVAYCCCGWLASAVATSAVLDGPGAAANPPIVTGMTECGGFPVRSTIIAALAATSLLKLSACKQGTTSENMAKGNPPAPAAA